MKREKTSLYVKTQVIFPSQFYANINETQLRGETEQSTSERRNKVEPLSSKERTSSKGLSDT